jgi:signal transduction histidine kinase
MSTRRSLLHDELPYDMELTGTNYGDLRTLTGKLLTVQDEERRKVSRDLHDDVNQRLGAIGLQLDSLCRHLPESPVAVRRQIRTIRRHVNKLSDDVRQLAYQFHQTTVEDLGFVVALQRYINDFVKRTGIKARFAKPRAGTSIPLRMATSLYSDRTGGFGECRTACQGFGDDRRTDDHAGNALFEHPRQRYRHEP